jgi:superfamily I DNA and/or RNA helicase
VDEGKIAIISPYSKQTSLWIKALARYPQLKGIRVITVNSFQGWEADYIMWDMTVSANAGGFFQWLADVCVSLTRHRYGLWILGDSRLLEGKNQLAASGSRHLNQPARDETGSAQTVSGRYSQ